jgi:signal peptidase II
MKRLAYLLIAQGVFVSDRLTKQLIEEGLGLYEFKTVIPGFLELTHTRNTGMAFGILSDSASPWVPLALATVSTLAFLLILGFALRNPVSRVRLQWGLMLILGGAAGNLHDRLTYGYVTDFIDVFYGSYHWPTFNLADSAITIGIGLFLIETLIRESDVAASAPGTGS